MKVTIILILFILFFALLAWTKPSPPGLPPNLYWVATDTCTVSYKYPYWYSRVHVTYINGHGEDWNKLIAMRPNVLAATKDCGEWVKHVEKELKRVRKHEQ